MQATMMIVRMMSAKTIEIRMVEIPKFSMIELEPSLSSSRSSYVADFYLNSIPRVSAKIVPISKSSMNSPKTSRLSS